MEYWKHAADLSQTTRRPATQGRKGGVSQVPKDGHAESWEPISDARRKTTDWLTSGTSSICVISPGLAKGKEPAIKSEGEDMDGTTGHGGVSPVQ